MRFNRAMRQQIERELELHFLFSRLLFEEESNRLLKEVDDLDKNLTINAKVQNLLNLTKQTRDDYEKIKTQLGQIEKEALEAGFKDFSPARLEKITREYVKDDTFYENRIVLALKFIFANDVDVHQSTKKKVYQKISKLLLFPRENALVELEISVKNNYKDISLVDKIDRSKLIRIGLISSLVVAGILGVTTLPLIGLGSSLSLGGAIAGSLITTTSIALASGAGAAGIAYVVKSKINEKKVLEEFSSLTPDELTYMLTFNATLLSYMRKLGVASETSAIKKRLDLFVKLHNHINVDYYLKQDELETNGQKKKIIAKCDAILQTAI